ncbi:T9SS type A sorting domain-containing protein [Rubricoccus marinus]|uniref:Secretion system C-terminal sorting domain-containing protein n=1 Tax=Rubricoccus marinus TaxID=716817 RepID=A0A259U109_9BACT|nr:T9SS type A sorting domain-containing protein [Rubricoccus marinus]OZC03528.1 hypothetical protein BSZ36_11360 [Rubricoccus marinus]
MRIVTRLLFLLPLAWAASPEAAAQFANPADPCPVGTAEVRLRGAEVEAALFTNGNLFFGNQTTNGDGYLVPLGQTGPRGFALSPNFAANLWVGGIVGGEVRSAGSRYTNFEMRPGLTGPNGVPPTPEACAEADRIWVVSRQDVVDYLAGGAPTADLAEWPVALGAPVLDGDGIEGNYDLASGDQPAIRGDVMAFWAMTDTVAERFAFSGEQEFPLGIDVTVEAFAFRQSLFGQHTFYRFTLTNRNAVPIDSAYVGLFNDYDLGDAGDDFLGTDADTQMLFVYNSQPNDDAYGVPPAFGTVVASGPVGLPNGRDDDGDGEADEDGERIGLTATSFFYGGTSASTTGDPVRNLQYYRYLKGLWADGSPKRANGSGYQQATRFPITPFAFPADPVTESYWSEVNVDGTGTRNPSGDRRGVASTGPFRLAPGASESVMFAYAFGQGEDRFSSVRVLRGQARGVLAAQASGAFEPERIGVIPPPLPLSVGRPRPNPFSGSTTVEVRGAAPEARLTVAVYDVLGRLVRAPEAVEGARGSVEVGAGLAAGVYVVRVEGAGFGETFTIVKTR